jgi:hypothetical protein
LPLPPLRSSRTIKIFRCDRGRCCTINTFRIFMRCSITMTLRSREIIGYQLYKNSYIFLRLRTFPLASFRLSLLDDIFVRSIFALFSRSFCGLSDYQTLSGEQTHSQPIVSFRGSSHRTLLILQQCRAKPLGVLLSGLPPCVVCRKVPRNSIRDTNILHRS